MTKINLDTTFGVFISLAMYYWSLAVLNNFPVSCIFVAIETYYAFVHDWVCEKY